MAAEAPTQFDQLTNASGEAQMLDEFVQVQLARELTSSERDKLSLALFPKTHTRTIKILGKDRTLNPLVVKISRQISAALKPFEELVVEGSSSEASVSIELITHVMNVSKVLAEYYGWEDVTAAIESEEIHLSELQALIVQQVNLQEMNDFLLLGLRQLVAMMQQAEMVAVRHQSTFSGLLLSNTTTAPLTS